MTPCSFCPKTIKTGRDVSVFEINNDQVMVVGCDSAGGIGPKPLDKVKVTGYTLGRFTARVALMEVMAVGATPVCLTDTLGVEPDPTGFEIVRGIKKAVELAQLDDSLPVIGSMEKTIEVEQTGIGITVVGLAPKNDLKIGLSKSEDLIVAIGQPSVKDEVLPAEKQGKIVDLTDVIELMTFDFVHELVPVGSHGLLHEVKVLSNDCGLSYNLDLTENEAKKSAGPATAVLVTVSKNALNQLLSAVNKPMQVIGSFYS
ncbi:MAG: AIR synthase related protein [archaeon]|nr:AIR synthase related protein [Candidatus Bathyarchaeum sp.]